MDKTSPGRTVPVYHLAMTIYRHEARGLSVNGEIFVYGVHTNKVGGVLADAHAAWIANNGKMWGGTAAPADSIKQLYNPGYTVVQAVTTEMHPVTSKNVAQLVTQTGLAGTGAGESFPPQVAICVSLRTDLPTRAGRGRFFLPATIISTIINGRLTAVAQDQMTKAVGLMLTGMKASGYPVVVLHRSTMTSDNVTRYDIGNVFDTMRTRRDKLVEVRQVAVPALADFLRDAGPEPDPAVLAAETPIYTRPQPFYANKASTRPRTA